MSELPGRPQGNPFSTRYVQPGALEFHFPDGADPSQLLERLRQAGWWGQVTGHHGAGKTTLLHSLCPLLQRDGRTVEWFTLHVGQRRLPVDLRGNWSSRDSRSLVIIDGYEQLGRFARWRLKSRCRRAGCGLLVTSHEDAGFPTTLEVHTSLGMVQHLVAHLLREQPGIVSNEDVADCFQAWNGNVREVMFALYDLYEMRRRDG